MKFADYLAMSVRGQQRESVPARKGNPNPIGWKARMVKADKRYQKAMGDKWMTTRDIERKLGMSSSTARYFLMSRLEVGKLERRKVGSVESWTRNLGYEWRWKK